MLMMMMKFVRHPAVAANLRGFRRPASSLINWKFQAARAMSAATKNHMIASSSPRYKVHYFNSNRFGGDNLRLQQQQQQQQQQHIYHLRRLFYRASSSSGSFRLLHNSKFSSSSHHHHHGGRGRRSDKNRERTAAIERNKKIVSLGKQQKWKEILDFYKIESRRLNNVNYATIMKQLEKIPSFNANTTTRNPIFLEFMDELATKIETLGLDWIGIREIANIVNAIGKMGFKKSTNNNNNNNDNIDGSERIIQFAAKTKNAHYIASKGKPQHISMICWGMSKFGDTKSLNNLFSTIEPQLARRLLLAKDDEELDPQVLSTLAYACAESGVKSRTIFAFIEEHATWLVENGTPQGISNSAWACATLGIQSPNLFAEIEMRSAWLVNNGMPQAISNTAWACATLGNRSPNLFAAIEKNSTWLVENGESRAISTTAWSCATLGIIHCPNLFAAIEKNSTWLVENGKPQEIANTAWAGATLGIHCPNLFGRIEERSKFLVANGEPQNISNTAWSFVKLRYASPNLLAAIEEDAARLVKNGSSQAVANVALAFATQGIPSSKYFGSIMDNLDKLLNEANEQGIVNLCYSIAVLDLAREFIEGFLTLWSKALRLNPKNISDEGWVQLAETYLFVAATGFKIQKPPKLPSEITFPDHPESRSHRDVSRTLKEIGFQHQQEVSPLLVNNDEQGQSPLLSSTPFLPPRMLAIDFACPERKIAIEFDGPYHFLIEVPSGKVSNVENGPTKAKRCFLQRLGWKVYNVRYDDWYHKGKNAQQDLLRSLLEC